MRVPCTCGREIEVLDTAIMSEAGRIAVRRRKTHRGGVPKTFSCYWCRAAIQTRSALAQHMRDCNQRPESGLVPFSEADLLALSWTSTNV